MNNTPNLTYATTQLKPGDVVFATTQDGIIVESTVKAILHYPDGTIGISLDMGSQPINTSHVFRFFTDALKSLKK